jgi:hypothetical protein
MTKILNYATMLVSFWLIVSPFVLGYQLVGIGICIGGGIIAIALAFISIKRGVSQWPSYLVILVGIFLILWGVFIAHLVGTAFSANEVVVGILLIILNLLILPFQIDCTDARFYNRNGGDLATMTQVRVKGNDVLAKAVLLGAMPETIYMKPEEICKAFSLVDAQVVLALPKILYLGWKNNRIQTKTNKSK